MPRIFDNIEQSLLPALKETLAVSERADFCVGYFNLRGWGRVDEFIEKWSGGGNCCRLLVGMQKLPEDELREVMSLSGDAGIVDAQRIVRLKIQAAEEFRTQLMVGAPTNADEATLRSLARQIRAGKVVIKLFLRHTLHAKLYLLYRQDFNNPISGYLGSSNLTLAGLSKQGELNVDVLDQDACLKLKDWFKDRWNDKWCLDISEELANIIEDSWAGKERLPYYIYLKMAYHLAQEARAGLAEFKLPADLRGKLLDFQAAAARIAAHHLHKRGGVLIGDVAGLGKTLMATAVARIFEDDFGLETLIICPKNLVTMWEKYVYDYRLRGKVLSIGQVQRELPGLRRYRVMVIDESHNLRNREGKRYRVIQEYIDANESNCILLSATPYNKSYRDLSSQLRLFVSEHADLGMRPEHLIRELGETEFIRKYQAPLRSLAAFEESDYPDDWRELMRLYLIRRTRSFIKENYAFTDENDRKYLEFEDNTRFYFPERVPRTLNFELDEENPTDQYACLYSDRVVNVINQLSLPRYGLGNYISNTAHKSASEEEAKQLANLTRAGKRLMGFCRINLFKRLESSGQAFQQSIDRHILRNYVYIYAIENNFPVPIGSQSAELLDASANDEDIDAPEIIQAVMDYDTENDSEPDEQVGKESIHLYSEEWYKERAKQLYDAYKGSKRKLFKWLRSELFEDSLRKELLKDAASLLELLREFGEWDPHYDTKLSALENLLTNKHPNEKVLVFTQFADTVRYLAKQLKGRDITVLEGVTGQSSNPTDIAYRFSPVSNEMVLAAGKQIRVLIATDVLSEGQNLQDCAIVVNYDLPWALIRLVQRVGRVDRIGQKAENVFCYSFLPAKGLEKIIRLRSRVKQRLIENGEVLGSDEQFFEDDLSNEVLRDLYTEKSGIFDADFDKEVDLASYAYQIWHNAITADHSLEKKIAGLPDVVYSTREHKGTEKEPAGVLVYVKTAEGNDSLAWIDEEGRSVTQSQLAVLRAAECGPEVPAIPRNPRHHELVLQGIQHIMQQEKMVGGQLGRPSGARYKTYDHLKRYREQLKKHEPLFASEALDKAIDDIYRYPLRSSATDTLNRQIRAGIPDEDLAGLVISLRDEDRLSLKQEEVEQQEPKIICSLGLFSKESTHKP